MKALVAIATAILFTVAGAAYGQKKGIADFGDKEFTAGDVVRALAPAPAAAPAQKSRGLSVGTDDAKEVAPAVAPAEAGSRKLSLRLQFGLNSADLTPVAKQRLDVVGEALASAELAKSNLIVSGHTDSTGSYDYNLRLSKRRADSVKLYLVSAHDIAPARLKAVGRGPDDPIDEANPASPLNRRVQLAIVE